LREEICRVLILAAPVQDEAADVEVGEVGEMGEIGGGEEKDGGVGLRGATDAEGKIAIA
jgi:hypothetical protein